MKKTLYIITLLIFIASCSTNIEDSKNNDNIQDANVEADVNTDVDTNYLPAEVAAPNKFPESGSELEGGTFN